MATDVGNYPGLANFSAQTNQDFDYTLTWTVDGSAVNLSGGSAIMQLRDDPSSSASLTISTTSGITLGGTAGTIRLQITDAQLGALTPGVYDYDLLVSQGTAETPLLRGSFTVNQGVSVWP